jgi:chorismate mutase
MTRNELSTEDVVSMFFTATPDLTAEFPAVAARKVGLHDVPLLCASEIDVCGALPRVVRLMAYVDVDRPRGAVRHVYLRGATALRQDLVH